VFQFAPGTDPVGSTFTVDVNMSNAQSEPIWGWDIGVSWNPAVLQLETITEGNYLASNGGLYDGSPTLFLAGPIDNTHGTVLQGISDLYLTNTTTTAASGTLCNLTFEVINYLSSYINITAGTPTLTDNLGNSQNVVLNNAQYVTLPPPPPQAPTAQISNGAPSNLYLPGAQITLNAVTTPGIDVVPNPNTPTFPVTTYSWSVVSGPSGFTSVPTGTSSITFNAPTPASGPFVIGLVVSTAANSGDPAYVNTSQMATITFSPAYDKPTDAGAQINVYIVNPNPTNTTYMYKSPTGLGIYNNTIPTGAYVDTFAPQELMNLHAFVTFNGASVADKIVAFTVQNESLVGISNATVATFTASTDDNGYAVASYRLPNYASSVMPFGNYTVTADVDVAGTLVKDCFTFQYNYVLNLTSVTQPAETARGQTASSMVTITDNSFQNQSYVLTWTVTDTNGVPIISGSIGGITTGVTSTQNLPLVIPAYSFVGTAILHVNLFNASPVTQNGLPYCPENDQTFIIAIPATQQTIPP
jgi:hypothetical protein